LGSCAVAAAGASARQATMSSIFTGIGIVLYALGGSPPGLAAALHG
jgi:hypothetical protein